MRQTEAPFKSIEVLASRSMTTALGLPSENGFVVLLEPHSLEDADKHVTKLRNFVDAIASLLKNCEVDQCIIKVDIFGDYCKDLMAAIEDLQLFDPIARTTVFGSASAAALDDFFTPLAGGFDCTTSV